MTNGRLAILVPSRGRPLTFLRFVESWLATTAGCSDIIVRNGTADPCYHEYDSFEGLPNLIRYVGDDAPYAGSITGNAGYLPAQQEMWERYPGYAAYLSIEDDCTFEEKGFDKTLLDMLSFYPNAVGCVRMTDLANQIEVYCVSAGWTSALGWMWPSEGGEPAFKIMPYICPSLYRADGPRFCHHPLLRSHGYQGHERRGALETPGIVEKFHGEGTKMEQWLFENITRLHDTLMKAAQCD